MRVLVRFSKMDMARYISHLDLLRLMQRVLRRAAVPLSYTQGFHPHPKMAFASALGVGIESRSEYMDLLLSQNVDMKQTMDDINRVLPAHIRVLGIAEINPSAKGLMGMVTAAAYLLFIPMDEKGLRKRCREIINAGTWPVTIVKKGKEQDADIRAGLHRLTVKDGAIDLLVDAGSRRNLNAVWFVDALWPKEERKQGETARIIRTDLYKGNAEDWTSLWDMEA
jgi:radical SAM-linked protein